MVVPLLTLPSMHNMKLNFKFFCLFGDLTFGVYMTFHLLVFADQLLLPSFCERLLVPVYASHSMLTMTSAYAIEKSILYSSLYVCDFVTCMHLLGCIQNKGIPPKYKQQWKHLPGHFEGAMEPCSNHIQGLNSITLKASWS